MTDRAAWVIIGAPPQKSNMNDSLKNRGGSLRLVLGLTGLAFSIFLWGLAYKLSLYAPAHTNFHRIAHAKLLSENERPASAAAPMSLAPSGSVDFALWTTLTGGLLLCALSIALRAVRERHSLLSLPSSCRQFHRGPYLCSIRFRPPPFLS